MQRRLTEFRRALCRSLRPLKLPYATAMVPREARWTGALGQARSASALQLFQESNWDRSDAKSALEQVADEGCLQKELHARLHGDGATTPVVAESADEVEVTEDVESMIQCGVADVLLVLSLCRSRRLRDFVLLSRLADRLVPEVRHVPVDQLVSLSSSFAALGALNQPLFDAIACALLMALPPGNDMETGAIVQVARAFAAQRSRHIALFDRLSSILLASFSPALVPHEALSLLHSLAFLRLDKLCGEDLWAKLEDRALDPDLKSLGPGPISELCHILFLSGRSGDRVPEIARMLDALAEPMLAAKETSWTSGEGLALQRRLLFLRCCMRYLHRDAYLGLSARTSEALRKVHRFEAPLQDPRPAVSFVRKLSHILTKIKVGHLCSVERGPLLLDVVERDRKLVYECNHFDRFYTGTTEKIASACLQERVVKAMGYRVVQIPHWQWNKLKHKKQRIEYVRMSRYYAIKDRREFGPRHEEPADVASNQNDYLGEYFFRKEAPSASWSWFQPRYDARKRIRPGSMPQ